MSIAELPIQVNREKVGQFCVERDIRPGRPFFAGSGASSDQRSDGRPYLFPLERKGLAVSGKFSG